MDRKSIIIIVVAVLLMFALPRLVDRVFPPVRVPIPPTNSAALSETNLESAGMTNFAAKILAHTNTAPERTFSISNDVVVWEFTSRGGGLKHIALRDYPAVVRKLPEGAVEHLATLNERAPEPVMAVLGAGLGGDDDFTLTRTGDTVRAEKTFPNGLRVVKEFDLGSNYLFHARVKFENTSAQPIPLPARDVVVGTATAAGPMDDPTVMGGMWYNGVKMQNFAAKWFANRTLGCIPGTPRTEYSETGNVVWAAADNQFFAIAAIPTNPAPGIQIDQLAVEAPLMDGPTNSTSAYLTNGYRTSLVYPPSVLPPHGSEQNAFTIYAGPKEYNRLAQIARHMDNNLDLLMNFTPPFGFFSKLLLLLLKALHSCGIAYGLAIIVITVAIKVIFWPLTNASTKSQKRLQALQPQIKAIADKYKDDPVKKNQKTMEFMKEHKVNPMGSCLPTLLQIPVIYGFYLMLRTAIELRGAHFLWAFDLSQPDTVAHLGTFPINPLPLIMGATQLWQSHMMPPTPGMDPGQQKIMRYMPLMFIAIFYRMSAGLNLYWTVQNVLTIVQIRLTNASDPAALTPASVPAARRKK